MGNIGGHFWVLSTPLLQVSLTQYVAGSPAHLVWMSQEGLWGALRLWLSGDEEGKVLKGMRLLEFDSVLTLVIVSGHSLFFSELTIFPSV